MAIEDEEDDHEDDVQEAVAKCNARASEKDLDENPSRPVAEEKSAGDRMAENIDEWRTYYDTLTGKKLDTKMVGEAMKE